MKKLDEFLESLYFLFSEKSGQAAFRAAVLGATLLILMFWATVSPLFEGASLMSLFFLLIFLPIAVAFGMAAFLMRAIETEHLKTMMTITLLILFMSGTMMYAILEILLAQVPRMTESVRLFFHFLGMITVCLTICNLLFSKMLSYEARRWVEAKKSNEIRKAKQYDNNNKIADKDALLQQKRTEFLLAMGETKLNQEIDEAKNQGLIE